MRSDLTSKVQNYLRNFSGEDFINEFDIIILPLPVTRDGIYIKY